MASNANGISVRVRRPVWHLTLTLEPKTPIFWLR